MLKSKKAQASPTQRSRSCHRPSFAKDCELNLEAQKPPRCFLFLAYTVARVPFGFHNFLLGSRYLVPANLLLFGTFAAITAKMAPRRPLRSISIYCARLDRARCQQTIRRDRV
jgi:hypothetical protein